MLDRGFFLTRQAIRRQLAAMPHDVYLIRLIHHATRRAFPGERLWTAAQLTSAATSAHSLREICQGLQASEGKLRHLGLSDAPRRSTLSYVNAHRPWQVYESVFHALWTRCASQAQVR